MTQSYHHNHHINEREHIEQVVTSVVDELKSKNIRITQPRKAIIHYMVASHSHPTVEEIYDDLLPMFPGMSLATIYNNLNILVEHGYVKEMKFTDIASRFDFMGHRHFHIICEVCGKVADFPYRDLMPFINDAKNSTGYQVNNASVEMFGVCENCQNKSV